MTQIKRKSRNPSSTTRRGLILARPSTWVFFWSLCFLSPTYPFSNLPFHNFSIPSYTFWFCITLGLFGILLRIAENLLTQKTLNAQDLKFNKLNRSKLKIITYATTLISLSAIIFSVVLILTQSDLSINSAQQALEDKSPSFGKVLAHLRTIAIPGILLLYHGRNSVLPKATIALFFILSAIYSFFGGERLFFFETAFSYLISREIVGNPLLKPKNAIIFATAAVLFFTTIEAGKRYFSRDYSTTDRIQLTEDIGYFLERPIAYYSDPIGKFHYAIEFQQPHSSFTWYENIVNQYARRIGLGIELSTTSINTRYWSNGYGYSGLTNAGGFTTLFLDFGWPFLLLTVLIILLSLQSLRSATRRKPLLFTMLHPLLCLALFEMPRIPYLYLPRFWLVGLTLLAIWTILSITNLKRKPLPRNNWICAES